MANLDDTEPFPPPQEDPRDLRDPGTNSAFDRTGRRIPMRAYGARPKGPRAWMFVVPVLALAAYPIATHWNDEHKPMFTDSTGVAGGNVMPGDSLTSDTPKSDTAKAAADSAKKKAAAKKKG